MNEKSVQVEEVAHHTDKLKKGNLLPIVLNISTHNILLIGGGSVALDKLRTILKNCQNISLKVISKSFKPITRNFLEENEITFEERIPSNNDFLGKNIIIVASHEPIINSLVKEWKENNSEKLFYVHGSPELSNFDLPFVLTRGDFKLTVSSNGKAEAFTQKVHHILEETFPQDTDQIVNNIQKIEEELAGDLSDKIKQLDDITSILLPNSVAVNPEENKKSNTLHNPIIIVSLVVTGFLLGKYITYEHIIQSFEWVDHSITSDIFIYIACGLVAQAINASMGMAFGTFANSFMMSFGVSPLVASASIHIAEIATTATSGLSHLKFGNVNSKLFKSLVVGGVLGGIAGAYLLSSLKPYAFYVKPVVALYTLIMGIAIIAKVLQKKPKRRKLKNVGWLATAGGFLSAIGGGGWGPVVTTTLLSSGHTPRYIIGSVSMAKFFVTLSISVMFIFMCGLEYFEAILGLAIGGVIITPFAAKMTKKLPVKAIMLLVGLLVILLSLRNIYNSIM